MTIELELASRSISASGEMQNHSPKRFSEFLLPSPRSAIASFSKEECDRFLELISRHALTEFKGGRLYLFDALIGNQQCHLGALRIAEIYQNCLSQNEPEAEEVKRTSKNRFIILSYLLSSCFSRNKNHLLSSFPPNALEDKKFKKRFSLFVNDNDLIRNARMQLAEDIHLYVLKCLAKLRDSSPFIKELSELSEENNLYVEDKSRIPLQLYCYPKFVGAFLMMRKIELSDVPLIFKIKVICSSGTQVHAYAIQKDGRIVKSSELAPQLLPQTPVVVIEGVALHDGLEIKQYLEERNLCPHGFFSKKEGTKVGAGGEQKIVHKLDEHCIVCSPCEELAACQCNVEHQEKLLQFSADSAVLGPAADFTDECQHLFADRFFNGDESGAKYPLLRESYRINLEVAHAAGFSGKCPNLLFVEHAYPDIASDALKPQRLLDSRPETLLNRGADDEK